MEKSAQYCEGRHEKVVYLLFLRHSFTQYVFDSHCMAGAQAQ